MPPLILIALGLLMLVADIFLFTIALLWLGIGFIIVGIIEFFYPMNFMLQILYLKEDI